MIFFSISKRFSRYPNQYLSMSFTQCKVMDNNSMVADQVVKSQDKMSPRRERKCHQGHQDVAGPSSEPLQSDVICGRSRSWCRVLLYQQTNSLTEQNIFPLVATGRSHHFMSFHLWGAVERYFYKKICWLSFQLFLVYFKELFFKVMKTFPVVYQRADSFMGWKAKIGSEDKETS